MDVVFDEHQRIYSDKLILYLLPILFVRFAFVFPLFYFMARNRI